jgi:hypothetical protein
MPVASTTTLVRVAVVEEERLALPPARADELHAVLLDEVGVPQLRQHAEPLEDPVGLGHERLADVEAGELRPLDDEGAVTGLRRQCADRRARGAATDHDHVVGFVKRLGHGCSVLISF